MSAERLAAAVAGAILGVTVSLVLAPASLPVPLATLLGAVAVGFERLAFADRG